MTEKIKVGVIGVGYLGKFHAQKYAAMDDVELVGVADVSTEMAQKIAKDNSTQAFSDYTKLLSMVDAVSVVVPTPLHHEVASACFAADVDVLLEKPMTVSLAEADDLQKKADAGKHILQVGHLERFNPAIVAMRDYLTCPVFIESHRIHRFTPRGSDVDVVLDLMIHDIDILLNIVPSPLENIKTIGASIITEETDVANAQLIFENGCTAKVAVSRVAADNIRSLRVYQSGGCITVNYATKEISVITRKPGFSDDGYPNEETTNFCFTEQDALAAELTDFVQNVRSRKTPLVSGKEGRRALEVALRIIDQIKDHKRRHKDLCCR